MKRLLALPAFLLALTAGAPLAAARPADEAEVARVRKQADDIIHAVEKLRGLELKRKVDVGIKDRDELRKFVLDELEKDMPDEKAKALERTYVKIGFLKPGVDLKKTLVDLYTEQIAGFYDPETKQLYLIEHGGPEQAMLMAHELTHALQDQSFDLQKLQKSIEDNDDRSMALTALIEGDATVAMVAFLLKEQAGVEMDVKSIPDIGMILKMSNQLGSLLGGDAGQEKIKNAPKILSEDLLFGYMAGASYCQKLIKAGGGYKAVSQAFKDLPVSTSQIMHPEKYAKHLQPIEVTLPDLAAKLGSGWKLLVKNVMGEFNTALLLKEKLSSGTADRAADGWAGDAWQALEGPDGQVVFCWYTTWETEKDAEEFDAAYKKFAHARDGDRSELAMVRDGKMVVIVDGASGETGRALFEAMGETKTRVGYGPAEAAAARPDEPAAKSGPVLANLRAPEGWKEMPVIGQAKAIFEGPHGERLTLDEGDAASNSMKKELQRYKKVFASARDFKGDEHVIGPDLGWMEYSLVLKEGEPRAHFLELMELRDGKLYTANLFSPLKGDASLRMLEEANPPLSAFFSPKGRRAAGEKKREPTLY